MNVKYLFRKSNQEIGMVMFLFLLVSLALETINCIKLIKTLFNKENEIYISATMRCYNM